MKVTQRSDGSFQCVSEPGESAGPRATAAAIATHLLDKALVARRLETIARDHRTSRADDLEQAKQHVLCNRLAEQAKHFASISRGESVSERRPGRATLR